MVDDVHTGFMHNTARMAADIRRMGSKTREARKRMIAAEEINELPLEGILMKKSVILSSLSRRKLYTIYQLSKE